MKRLGTQQPPTFEELIVERKDGTVLSPCYYVPARSAWRFEGVDIPEDPYDIWQTCEAYKRRSSAKLGPMPKKEWRKSKAPDGTYIYYEVDVYPNQKNF